jgi:hypothetical protein
MPSKKETVAQVHVSADLYSHYILKHLGKELLIKSARATVWPYASYWVTCGEYLFSLQVMMIYVALQYIGLFSPFSPLPLRHYVYSLDWPTKLRYFLIEPAQAIVAIFAIFYLAPEAISRPLSLSYVFAKHAFWCILPMSVEFISDFYESVRFVHRWVNPVRVVLLVVLVVDSKLDLLNLWDDSSFMKRTNASLCMMFVSFITIKRLLEVLLESSINLYKSSAARRLMLVAISFLLLFFHWVVPSRMELPGASQTQICRQRLLEQLDAAQAELRADALAAQVVRLSPGREAGDALANTGHIIYIDRM